MSEQLFFNGINGATGDYDLPPMTPEQLASVIAGEAVDEGLLNELKQRRETHWAVKEGVDPNDLAQAGWGIIMAHKADPAIKDALSELLQHRRRQAGERYREYVASTGYRPGETKNKFLSRFGVGPGPADPDKVPYYLLIVGDPETIPYRFQSQLDVQYAVGRIHFDTLDEYAAYARSVVQAETGGLALPRQAAFFGVRTPGDQATLLSADQLIKPLADKLSATDWSLRALLEAQATKSQLSRLLGGAETPALLFTASHGMGFPKGDARQLPHQGALLCQDWPGPGKWKKAIPTDFYFSADDVGGDARLLGSMAFFFACYGAGTPRLDEFAQHAFKERAEIAPQAFLAKLPRRLLGHPKGGLLAVVGHVERAWGYSFSWDRAGAQTTVFESALTQLMAGAPVGLAFEYFNDRYAEISSDLTVMVEDKRFDEPVDDVALAGMWTANNDARNYCILGDPAARLPLAAEGQAETARAAIQPVEIKAGGKSAEAKLATAMPAAMSAPVESAAPAEPEPEKTPDQSDAVSFALGQERSNLADSLKGFVSELAKSLSQAADDISSLEVATYTSGDLEGVKYDYGTKKLAGQLKLRALTRIAFDGDAQICVPEKEDGIDRDLWQVHLDMVKEAQANRVQFLQSMAEMATKLIEMLKP
jgi:acylphosphatase